MSEPSPWREPAAHVLPLLSSDPAAAFAHLDTLAPPEDPHGWVPVFRNVAGELYWQHQALREYTEIGREVVRRLEAALAATEGPEPPDALVRPLGGTCYNLAAFAWPGWDEPGLTVDPESLAASAAAAHRCLAVRTDPAHQHVQFGYTPSMAHWVVGAHALSAGDYGAARKHFTLARDLDLAAGEPGLLNAGYLALAALVANPADSDAEQQFNATLAQLAARTNDEDAAFYREQLITARRFFS